MQIPSPIPVELVVWIKFLSGAGGLFLIIYGIIKGWYQIGMYRDDRRIKRIERLRAEQQWEDEIKRRKNL